MLPSFYNYFSFLNQQLKICVRFNLFYPKTNFCDLMVTGEWHNIKNIAIQCVFCVVCHRQTAKHKKMRTCQRGLEKPHEKKLVNFPLFAAQKRAARAKKSLYTYRAPGGSSFSEAGCRGTGTLPVCGHWADGLPADRQRGTGRKRRGSKQQ